MLESATNRPIGGRARVRVVDVVHGDRPRDTIRASPRTPRNAEAAASAPPRPRHPVQARAAGVPPVPRARAARRAARGRGRQVELEQHHRATTTPAQANRPRSQNHGANGTTARQRAWTGPRGTNLPSGRGGRRRSSQPLLSVVPRSLELAARRRRLRARPRPRRAGTGLAIRRPRGRRHTCRRRADPCCRRPPA